MNRSSTDPSNINPKTIINVVEDGGAGHSLVAISENVFDRKKLAEWRRHLDHMTFYGGTTSFGDIPREQAWFYDGGGNFGDRVHWKDKHNDRWISRNYSDVLRDIQSQVQTYHDEFVFGGVIGDLPGIRHDTFDSCLINKYRGLGDSIKPHRDSETVFGNNPSVAILSIGCTREIVFQRILYNKSRLNSIKRDQAFDGQQTIRITMPSGSILFMGGETQKYYSHEIKKVNVDPVSSKKHVDREDFVRYSLTFRQYVGHD